MLNEFEEISAKDELEPVEKKNQTSSAIDFIVEKLPTHLLNSLRHYFFQNPEEKPPFTRTIQNLILLFGIYSAWKIVTFLSYSIHFLWRDDLVWNSYFTEDLITRIILIAGTIMLYQKHPRGWILLTGYCLYLLVMQSIQSFYVWSHFDAPSLEISSLGLWFILSDIWTLAEIALFGIFLKTLSSEKVRTSYSISQQRMYLTFVLSAIGTILLYLQPIWDELLHMLLG